MNYTQQQIEALWIMFLRTPANAMPDVNGMFDLGEIGEAACLAFTRMTPYSPAHRKDRNETHETHAITFEARMRAEAERLIAEGRMPPLDKV